MATTFGDATVQLIERVFGEGVQHAVVLMRHSAREFEPGRHDLENPLTEEGRDLARRFGERLDKQLTLRGYSSPAERCVETAELILAAHQQTGGRVSRQRPVEALGVFYVLDQMKMFKAMLAAEGQSGLLDRWFADELAADVMMPANLAARIATRVAAEKLRQPLGDTPQLDVCVSHDMTLYLIRDRLLGERSSKLGQVAFLDGLVMFERDGATIVCSQHGGRAEVDLRI